jgi:hypothetical protein
VAREIYLDLKAQQPDAEQIERLDPLAEWMAAFGAKHGVEYSEELITGQFTIDQLPDSVTMRAGLQYLPMQYTPYGGTAVVQHGGAATIATTARHPVPQLALHYHYDQPTIGRLLAEHGAGLAMHTSQATGASVRDAIVRLLREPGFRHRAADLRAEILAAPSPNQLVPRLEELTVTHQTA